MTRNLPQIAVAVSVAVFLILYSAQKYFAAAPSGLNLTYIVSVAILVALTALVPLVATWFATRMLPGNKVRLVIAAALPLALSAAGLWLYWVVFLNPNFGVPLDVVMPRALFPGVSLGVLMVAGVLAANRDRVSTPS